MAKYVCNVCGWEYDGDVPFEELPDDYMCPMCGAPKSEFDKIDD
jgi:rubredoxin